MSRELLRESTREIERSIEREIERDRERSGEKDSDLEMCGSSACLTCNCDGQERQGSSAEGRNRRCLPSASDKGVDL